MTAPTSSYGLAPSLTLSSSLTAEDMAEKLMNLSEAEAVNFIQHISNDLGNLVKIFLGIASSHESLNLKKRLVNTLVSQTPFITVLNEIGDKDYLAYCQLFLLVSDLELRKKILCKFEENNQEPVFKVVNLLQAVIDSDWDQYKKNVVTLIIIRTIEEHKLNELISNIVKNFTIKDLAQLFLQKTDSEILKTVIEEFCFFYRAPDSYVFECSFLIDELINFSKKNSAGPSKFLEQLLIYLAENDNKIFLTIWDKCQISSRPSIFWALPSNFRMRIFSRFALEDNPLTFLQELLSFEKTLDGKCSIIYEYTSYLSGVELQQLFIEIHSAAPELMLVLLCSMSEDAFLEWSYLDPEFKTDMLVKIPVEANAIDFRSCISRLICYYDRSSQLLNQVQYDVDSENIPCDPLTFSEIVDHIIRALNSDLMSTYEMLLHRVPPVVMTLAFLKGKYRKLIYKITTYLSERQLIAITKVIPERRCYKMVRKMALLRMDQHELILNAFTERQLFYYINYKIDELQIRNSLIESKKDEFDNESIQIFQTDPTLIDTSIINGILLKGYQILGISREINSPLNRKILQKCFTFQLNGSSDQKRLLFRLKNILNGVEECQSDLQEKLRNLATVKPDERDPIEEISTYYWVLLRTEMVQMLGLEHAGELLEYGIRSDNDFNVLGLSLKRLNIFNSLKQNLISYAKPDKKEQAEDLWNAFISPNHIYGEYSYKRIKIRFVYLLLRHRTLEECKDVIRSIFAEGQPLLTWINPDYLKIFNHLISNVEQCENVRSHCSNILDLLLDNIKNEHFYHRLYNYLFQPSCNHTKVWKVLKEHHFDSLSQLYEAKLIESPNDCLNMIQVLRKIDPDFVDSDDESGDFFEEPSLLPPMLFEMSDDDENI